MTNNIDDMFLSSPDPLNDSAILSSPPKTTLAKTRRSFPSQESSPRKQTFQLDVGDQLSPQKIRVTVEAEHSESYGIGGRKRSGGQRSPSPTRYRTPAIRQSIRTTTTTIPVKGLSDNDDDLLDSELGKPTEGRGRSRKSVGMTAPGGSRIRVQTPSAKPSPRRRKTFGHLVDGDDLEDWDFAIGAGVEVSRGKGRSRSRSVKGRTQTKSTPVAHTTVCSDKTTSSTSSKGVRGRGRGRRKTLTPEEIIIHEDETNLISNIDLSGKHQEPNTHGVLAQRDINLVSTSSTSLGYDQIRQLEDQCPEFQHDKFSPVNKASVPKGRLTLRSELAGVEPSTSFPADIAARSTNQPTQSTVQPVIDLEGRDVEVVENLHQDRSDNEEIRESDTILESEEFSMISVDSVPSLREHVSSPSAGDKNDEGNQSSAIKGKRYSLKNDSMACEEDSFSSIAPEILEAATPRKRPSRNLLRAVLSSKIPREEDSFSSIPSEILEAASPQKRQNVNTLLPVKLMDDEINEDSFSSIPQAIFETVTPAKHIPIKITNLKAVAEPNQSFEITIKSAAISSSQPLEAGKQSITGSGLLTPNETPSPRETSSQNPEMPGQDSNCLEFEPCSLLPENSAIEKSQFRSSPPSTGHLGSTYAPYARQSNLLHASHLETPSVAFSSPTLPPLIQPIPVQRLGKLPNLDASQVPQQSLSPIIQAGQLLQDITVKSASKDHVQGLGSPFKSPAALYKTSEALVNYFDYGDDNLKQRISPEKGKGNETDLFVGFGDDTMRELRKSMGIGEELAESQRDTVSINSTTVVHREDPFHCGKQSIGMDPKDVSKMYSLEIPSYKLGSFVGLPREGIQQNTSVHSDSAMSWQAESTIPVRSSPEDANNTEKTDDFDSTEIYQQRKEAEWALERAVVRSQIESASPSKVIVIESDTEEPAELNAEGDEGEDIWQIEARHSSPIVGKQSQIVASRHVPPEKSRRSKIPSPWRKTSKGLIYNYKLLQSSSSASPVTLSDKNVKPRREPTKITFPKGALPHDIVEYEDDMPESSIMWHIPQKANFTPRPRRRGNLDLSALLGSSPLKRPQNVQPQSESVIFDSSRDGNIQYSIPTHITSPSRASPKAESQVFNEEAQSTNYSIPGESVIHATNSGPEDSGINIEPIHASASVHYPTLPKPTSLSPQKSCLRIPTSSSPTKSVAFLSPVPFSSPLATLSSEVWSKPHWKLLHSIYNLKKSNIASYINVQVENVDRQNHETSGGVIEPSKYLGKTIQAQGHKLILEQYHLDIVQEFREKVPGWEEGVIAKRLFAIIAGEYIRKRGKE